MFIKNHKDKHFFNFSPRRAKNIKKIAEDDINPSVVLGGELEQTINKIRSVYSRYYFARCFLSLPDEPAVLGVEMIELEQDWTNGVLEFSEWGNKYLLQSIQYRLREAESEEEESKEGREQ